MTISTHCLPNGVLGTNEIPVCNVSDATVDVYIPAGGLGSGNIRGVVVSMHGLSIGLLQLPAALVVNLNTPNTSVFGFESYDPAFTVNLVNDGWIVLGVPYPEDFYVGIGATAIWNDVASDSGHGSRYLTNQMHWWDHVVEYIHLKYGANIPIVPYGGSYGGYHTLLVAANRQSSIIAYCADVPATIISNASPTFTFPANYGPTAVTGDGNTVPPLPAGGTSGMDIGQTALNANSVNPNGVTVPGIVTYGTNDEAVGWQTTASLPGVGPIDSNTDAMLTNATNAGLPVLRNQTSDFHEFTNDDAGYSATFTPAGPTALSALSALYITNPYPNGSLAALNSGQCSIWASDNNWHTITFTGFHFTSYTTTAVTNVATSMPSSLTLGSMTGLSVTSGLISIPTSGTTLKATFGGVSGSTLTGVSYVSGSGNIAGTSFSTVTLVTYVTTAVTNVATSLPTTLTLSSVVGLYNGPGQVNISTTGTALLANYNGVSGSTITNVSYVSGSGNIAGTSASVVSLMTPLAGCSYSGTTSATVVAGAAVTLHGIPITGGFMNMGLPHWFAQYVDPVLAPRQF